MGHRLARAGAAILGTRVRATVHELNVDLEYSGDVEGPKQATLVQNAIDREVDGLAFTLAFPEAVGPVVARASEAGIPVVALNAGMDVYQEYGASMFVGSDEGIAGRSAGERIAEEGGPRRSA